MQLTLRRNHFFRSFWSVERARELNEKDVKYLDLDAIDENMWNAKIVGINISNPVNLSYWNTYNVGTVNDCLFQYLLNFYTAAVDKNGIKNVRTDNMGGGDFYLLTALEDPEHLNNNWKTAHLRDLPYSNPHWNRYHHGKYD
jgi:hypothetical protein